MVRFGRFGAKSSVGQVTRKAVKQSEATRKRRSELCKARQGQNGKWESNAKKVLARKARRSSLKIGTLFERGKSKRAARDAVTLAEAKDIAKKLGNLAATNSTGAVAEQVPLIPTALFLSIEALIVTGALLRRTTLVQALRSAAALSPVDKQRAAPLLAQWRTIFRQDVEKAKEAAADKQRAIRAASEILPPAILSSSSKPTLAPCTGPVLPLIEAFANGSAPMQDDDESSSSSSSGSSSSSASSAPAPRPTVLQSKGAPEPATSSKKKPKQQRLTSFLLSRSGA